MPAAISAVPLDETAMVQGVGTFAARAQIGYGWELARAPRSTKLERLGLDLLRLDGSPLLPAVLGSPLVDGIAVGGLISRLPCLDGLAVSFSELAIALAGRFPAFLVSRVFPSSTHRSTSHYVMAPRACSRR
jgi:hypothetical protein